MSFASGWLFAQETLQATEYPLSLLDRGQSCEPINRKNKLKVRPAAAAIRISTGLLDQRTEVPRGASCARQRVPVLSQILTATRGRGKRSDAA